MSLTTVDSAALTERSATALAAAIASGELSALDVVEAHIERIERFDEQINAVVARRFEQARGEAREADARIAAADGGEALPPLLGVPCTIKESFAVAGMPNSAGLVSRKDERAKTTATAAQRLIDAGAIPLGVTNVSELTMWIESNNRVYGRTNNAYDQRRTAGGSSGGEGASVGAGFAPIGLGSDIGGSIRLPAFFNGVFGHKNTPGWVPISGIYPEASGESWRMFAVGPLARRAEDLMPFLRAIAGPDGQDASVYEAQIGDPADVALEGLDVIVSESTSVLPAARELRDARDRAADALAGRGARVRRESLKSVRRTVEYYLAALSDGAGDDVPSILGFDPATPPRLRRLALDAARGRGPHTIPTLILLASERVNKRMPLRRTRKALEAGRALAEELKGVIGTGVLLHPPFARVAPRHGRTIGRPWLLAHPGLFNLTGLPVTQVPLGLGSEGLPLGVQVAALPDADHRTIAVALELERAFGGWVPPPRLR